MIDFQIKLGGRSISSNDIYNNYKQNRNKDITVYYITKQTGCSKAEALEALNDVLAMAKAQSEPPTLQERPEFTAVRQSVNNETIDVTCPYCHSTNVEKITLGKRVVKGYLWGAAAANTLVKEWHCKNCKSNF